MTKEQVKRMLDIFCLIEGKEANYKDSTLDLIHKLIEAKIAIEKLDEERAEISKDVDELLEKIKHQDK